METFINEIEKQRFINNYDVKQGGSFKPITEEALLREHILEDIGDFTKLTLFGADLLNEGKIIPGSDKLLSDFRDYYYSYLYPFVHEKKPVSKTWNYKSDGLFVPEIIFEFNISYNDDINEPLNKLNSAFKNRHVEIITDGTYRHVDYKQITITVTLEGNDNIAIYKALKTFIYHELIHSYEDYQRLLKKTGNGLYDVAKDTNYAGAPDEIDKPTYFNIIKNELDNFLYITNTVERNAYVGQLNADTMDVGDLHGSITQLEQTPSYLKLQEVKKIYNNFLAFKLPVYKKKEMTPEKEAEIEQIKIIQSYLVQRYNQLTGLELETYTDVLHDMSVRKGCFERHFNRKSSDLIKKQLLQKMYEGTLYGKPEPNSDFYLLEEKGSYVVEMDM